MAIEAAWRTHALANESGSFNAPMRKVERSCAAAEKDAPTFWNAGGRPACPVGSAGWQTALCRARAPTVKFSKEGNSRVS